jgi:hypothetical protein
MLLKGLPRPQLLLPAWTARNLAFVPQHARNSSGKGSNNESQSQDEPTLSLFEELFPEESKELHKAERSPANIGDSQGLQKDEESRSTLRTKSTQHQQHFKIVKHLARDWEKHPSWPVTQRGSAGNVGNDQYQFRELRDTSVLALSNASKSLSLSDFLRLSPQGEHIDGWASGIIKGKLYGNNQPEPL